LTGSCPTILHLAIPGGAGEWLGVAGLAEEFCYQGALALAGRWWHGKGSVAFLWYQGIISIFRMYWTGIGNLKRR